MSATQGSAAPELRPANETEAPPMTAEPPLWRNRRIRRGALALAAVAAVLLLLARPLQKRMHGVE
jgi:ferric-dicitrate binding protein FerR (iron transport regulator)